MDPFLIKFIAIVVLPYILMYIIWSIGRKLKNEADNMRTRDVEDTGSLICLLAIISMLVFTFSTLWLLRNF